MVLAVAPDMAPATGASADLTVLTRETNDTIAEGLLVIRLQGAIEPPLAMELRTIWARLGASHERLLLDLDSPGGALSEAEAVIKVIAKIRKTAAVNTLVRHDAMCASACVSVFVQGTKRSAGGSSTWMFHGVCRERTNIPHLGQTDRFLDLLREAGVSADFLGRLVREGYVTTPGKLWLSGYELVYVFHANVITNLLPPWRPERPQAPALYSRIGPQ